MSACIRLATAADAPALLAIYKPFITDTACTFEEIVPTESDFATRVWQVGEKCPWLVCEVDGAVAGYAYAGDHRTRACYRWTKETSVYVHPAYRRMKIASALYHALLPLLALQGVTNVLAGITIPNDHSVAFHEALGFTPVGVYKNIGYKLGQWHAVGWWELALAPVDEAPMPNLKLTVELCAMPEYTQILEAAQTKLRVLKA